MTDYDLTPIDSQLDGVRLYGDSMKPIARGQTHEAERHAVIEGGAPTSDSDGLEPGQIGLRGTWLGATAGTLADRLRAIINDPDVTTVSIDGVDGSGTSITTPYDGDYRIADSATVEQVIPGRDEAWEYRLTLIEL